MAWATARSFKGEVTLVNRKRSHQCQDRQASTLEKDHTVRLCKADQVITESLPLDRIICLVRLGKKIPGED